MYIYIHIYTYKLYKEPVSYVYKLHKEPIYKRFIYVCMYIRMYKRYQISTSEDREIVSDPV